MTAAKQEATCFGNDEIYIEKFIQNPRALNFRYLPIIMAM